MRNIHNVRHSIGYCPQFDAINDKLTGKEHLILQAQLKGMSTDEMKEASRLLSNKSISKQQVVEEVGIGRQTSRLVIDKEMLAESLGGSR